MNSKCYHNTDTYYEKNSFRYKCVWRVHVLPVDEETAEFYAKVYRDLKTKGKPIPSNDMWIAASALRHGLSLLTLDEHFNHIDGLILKSKAL